MKNDNKQLNIHLLLIWLPVSGEIKLNQLVKWDVLALYTINSMDTPVTSNLRRKTFICCYLKDF